MTNKKVSKAAVRRLAQEINSRHQGRQLPRELQLLLDGYTPASIAPQTYQSVKPTMNEIMRRTTTTGPEKFRQQRQYVAQLAAWSHEHGLSLEPELLLTVGRIVTFIASPRCAHLSDASRADLRSDLLEIAKQANPAYDGIRRAQPIARPRVKPPYLPAEAATIVRVARNQKTAVRRQSMCAVVGLGLGAGLDSTDIKPLRRCHVVEVDTNQLDVHVSGRRPRIVPVRNRYVDLVRDGLTGLRPNDLVIGRNEDRKDVVNRVVAQAVIPSTCPHVEQTRLRATYLAELIQINLPLLDLLDIAGLKSVQTLVDIARYLREQESDR
ncbi:hypothetical protein [Egicoccus halophilus]|uniref:hypothetical protein n=1 Tax=Egicoccus halophilus TaxID=1670830 RepID=UPI00103238AA|nr:hypothetical protein [Egicoccus halophilus]